MEGVKNFNPDKDIPSLAGKVVFVTGGTAGLGSQSVQALAKHNPAHIYFSGRSTTRGQALITDIKKTIPTASLTFLEIDLSSLESVKTGIQNFTHDKLDILMCNAGIMAKPPGLSADGYEIQFATNHLGHALLIKKLLPMLIRAAEEPGSDVRVVNLTSVGWRTHPQEGVVFNKLKTTQAGMFGHWVRYGQSKLANIVYAAELARRYPKITSVSVHPGVVPTSLVGDLGFWDKAMVYLPNLGKMLTLEEGALSQLWVAVGGAKKDIKNGGFYLPVGVLKNSMLDKVAKSETFAKELWDWTEKALDGY